MALLSLNKFGVAIGRKQIIAGVDLALAENEILVIIGPNGSGKSTLAMGMSGMPGYKTQGDIKFRSQVVNKLSIIKRLKLGMFLAWQSPVAIPEVKVSDYLWAVYKANLQPSQKQMTILDFYKLVKVLARKYHLKESVLESLLNTDLSGGEKKKLQLLELEIIKPKLVILDEIDSGLDMNGQKIVANSVRQFSKTKIACVIITHNLKFARSLKPDKVMVIKDGRVIRSGKNDLLKQVEKYGYELAQRSK